MIGTNSDITERKQAEEALRLSEETLSKIFRANPEAIAITRMEDGVYIEVNQVFLELFGLGRDEVIGHSSLDLNVWSDLEDRRKYLEALSKHGFVRNFETRYKLRDGRILDFMVSSEVILIQGKPCSLNFILDLSVLKKISKDLLESENQSHLLFENAPMGMAIMDSTSGRFITANPKMGEILESDHKQLVDHTFQDFTHPEHLMEDLASVQDLASGTTNGISKEKRYLLTSGNTVWVTACLP